MAYGYRLCDTPNEAKVPSKKNQTDICMYISIYICVCVCKCMCICMCVYVYVLYNYMHYIFFPSSFFCVYI